MIQARRADWAAGTCFSFAVLLAEPGVTADLSEASASGDWTMRPSRARSATGSPRPRAGGASPPAPSTLFALGRSACRGGDRWNDWNSCTAGNHASCRVAEKAGFSFSAVLPPLLPDFPDDGHLHIRRASWRSQPRPTGQARCRAKNRSESSASNRGRSPCLPGLACSVFSAEPMASNNARLCSRGICSSSHWTRNCTGTVICAATSRDGRPLQPQHRGADPRPRRPAASAERAAQRHAPIAHRPAADMVELLGLRSGPPAIRRRSARPGACTWRCRAQPSGRRGDPRGPGLGPPGRLVGRAGRRRIGVDPATANPPSAAKRRARATMRQGPSCAARRRAPSGSGDGCRWPLPASTARQGSRRG